MKIREIKARTSHECVAAQDGSWARNCLPIRSGETYWRVSIFPAEALFLYDAGDIEARNHPESVALCRVCGPGYVQIGDEFTPPTPATPDEEATA